MERQDGPGAGLKLRIARLIAEFDGQGHHRTATEVDHVSGTWLRDLLIGAGVDASVETYPFSRLVIGESYLAAGSERIDGLPAFDCGLTSGSGVTGRLGPIGSTAEIGFVVAAPGGASTELDDARKNAAHAAIIHVTEAGRPGLAPRNATSFLDPFGPPVLQVSSEHRELIERLSSAGVTATVVASGTREPTHASNVVAIVPGRSRSLPPLVVMTPRSGWWQCASERGGGLACLVEIARAVAREPLSRDLLFVASTGHELGHWGLEQYLATRERLATDAVLWVHFGASIGAALSPKPFLFASSRDLQNQAEQALRRAGSPPIALAPETAVPSGESKNVHERGGRYVSFLGGSAVFHLEEDRWPEAVDVGVVEAYLEGCLGFIRSLDASAANTAAAAARD